MSIYETPKKLTLQEAVQQLVNTGTTNWHVDPDEVVITEKDHESVAVIAQLFGEEDPRSVLDLLQQTGVLQAQGDMLNDEVVNDALAHIQEQEEREFDRKNG
jgi:3-dehydroquinate synthase class II